MSRHDPLVRIKHMLDFAREAVEMAVGKNARDLDEDRKLTLALTHLVELIGEASSQVPQEVRAKYPAIPWPQITRMRNRLIHGYDVVDYKILWDTVTQDLPVLIKEIWKRSAALSNQLQPMIDAAIGIPIYRALDSALTSTRREASSESDAILC